MKKSLIIVESPTKAKTINKYLKNTCEVISTVGHFIDLPESEFGLDLSNGEFIPSYTPIKGKTKLIKSLKFAIQNADNIYLAVDSDREGEAIAIHLVNFIKEKNLDAQVFRVRFHEVTASSIFKSLLTPVNFNLNSFYTQQTRRILDRIVGYKISPILWRNVCYGLSAGRVQSAAMRIIVDREREIVNFIPKEHWSINVQFVDSKNRNLQTSLFKVGNSKVCLNTKNEAIAVQLSFNDLRFSVFSVKKKNRCRNASPPFITSSLQQDAARAFQFSPKKTMMIAQTLYEGIDLGDIHGVQGLITYMRTDSVETSREMITKTRELIRNSYGEEFLPLTFNKYKNKKAAQGAHEAIRPTSFMYSPEFVKHFLTSDQNKLYKLIWDRFISSQMTPVKYEQLQVDINSQKYTFRLTESTLVFKGFLEVYDQHIKTNKTGELSENFNVRFDSLSDLKVGEVVFLVKSEPIYHITQPPSKFTEAGLIKELEGLGIGRPSTYANILSVIQEKKYAERINGRLSPTDLGFKIVDLLVKTFEKIMNPKFTAYMEENLDKVEKGAVSWHKVLAKFYESFTRSANFADKFMQEIKIIEQKTDIKCSKCQSDMVIKWGKNGSFLACSSYPICNHSSNFTKHHNKINILDNQQSEKLCKECKLPLLVKHGRFGTFLGCTNYPNCNFTMSKSLDLRCTNGDCDGEIIERRSRRNMIFYGCTNYPICKFISRRKPVH